MERILVSACLLGSPVRYNGTAKPVHADLVSRWRSEGRLIPFCPEIEGGLPVPREPAELTGSAQSVLDGSVLEGEAVIRTRSGADVTPYFLRGARLALETARRFGARMALLKEGSPSCGSHRVYDGTFTGASVPGAGVTAALLERNGIRVFSENNLEAANAYLTSLEPS